MKEKEEREEEREENVQKRIIVFTIWCFQNEMIN